MGKTRPNYSLLLFEWAQVSDSVVLLESRQRHECETAILRARDHHPQLQHRREGGRLRSAELCSGEFDRRFTIHYFPSINCFH